MTAAEMAHQGGLEYLIRRNYAEFNQGVTPQYRHPPTVAAANPHMKRGDPLRIAPGLVVVRVPSVQPV